MFDFLSDACSIIASLLLLVVLVVYLRQVVGGSSTPNPATWFIFASVGIINSITYFYIAHEELFQFLTTAVSAIGLSTVFIYALYSGRISKVGLAEVVTLILAAAIVVKWQMSDDPVATNLWLQPVYFISFIPTIIKLLKHQAKEKPLPWDLAILSYLFMTLAVFLKWGIENPAALIFPILNGIIGNGVVSTIAHAQLQTKKPR